MNKIITVFIVLLTLTFTQVSAKKYKVEDVPMVHLQDRTKYVSNPDGILHAGTVQSIDETLYNLEQKTGIQVIVAILTSIEGGDCFDFAYQLGEKMGVGEKGRDNGLVILLSLEERCVQFATGYGLEGALPDAICKRIQKRYMLPHFKNDDWNFGMLSGIKAVAGYLDGSMEKQQAEFDTGDKVAAAVFVIVIGLIIGLAFYGAVMNGRCPKCKKKQSLQRISSKVISKQNGVIISEVIYLCSHCGHKVTKHEKSYDDNFHGPRRHNGGGFFVGGGGFGSSGGGGISGGSFGGGSFGGGGAGSRF